MTFDPFNVLSVPIPKQATGPTLSINYYSLDLSEPVLEIKISLSSEQAKVQEIKAKVREAISRQSNVSLDQITPPIICVTQDNRI